MAQRTPTGIFTRLTMQRIKDCVKKQKKNKLEIKEKRNKFTSCVFPN